MMPSNLFNMMSAPQLYPANQMHELPRPHTSYIQPVTEVEIADMPLDEQGAVNLQLEELQKVFDLFHTDLQTVNVEPRLIRMGHPPTIQKRVRKVHNFKEVQIQDRIGTDTRIPHLDRDTSLFFTSYHDDKFEQIFEDLKIHYQLLCEEEPERGSDD